MPPPPQPPTPHTHTHTHTHITNNHHLLSPLLIIPEMSVRRHSRLALSHSLVLLLLLLFFYLSFLFSVSPSISCLRFSTMPFNPLHRFLPPPLPPHQPSPCSVTFSLTSFFFFFFTIMAVKICRKSRGGSIRIICGFTTCK